MICICISTSVQLSVIFVAFRSYTLNTEKSTSNPSNYQIMEKNFTNSVLQISTIELLSLIIVHDL